MNSGNKFKKELEQLYKEEENSRCFDCDKEPAHWASVNNGIYLCLDCSGEHRGFGVGVSYIKSVTLDQWTESQYNLLRVGGNQRLKEFLISNEMPEYLDKKEIYSSKLMSYYRRMLKVESRNELFMEPMPNRENFWDPADSSDLNDNYSNSNYSNNLFGNNNSFGYNNSYNNNSQKSEMFNFNENSIPDYSKTTKNTYNEYNNYNSSSYNKAYDNNNNFPKSEIVISDDHYQQARNNISSSYRNSAPSAPKFKNIDPKYKNDSRYASIGSEPIDSYTPITGGGYMATVGNVLGTIWNTSVNAASVVKDKMTEYEVGSKLMYVGGKAIEAIAYTGSKVIEKGTEIAQSETMQNIVAKAGEGIGNLKDKITGKSSGSGGYYGNSSSLNGDYSSRGSDDY